MSSMDLVAGGLRPCPCCVLRVGVRWLGRSSPLFSFRASAVAAPPRIVYSRFSWFRSPLFLFIYIFSKVGRASRTPPLLTRFQPPLPLRFAPLPPPLSWGGISACYPHVPCYNTFICVVGMLVVMGYPGSTGLYFSI